MSRSLDLMDLLAKTIIHLQKKVYLRHALAMIRDAAAHRLGPRGKIIILTCSTDLAVVKLGIL